MSTGPSRRDTHKKNRQRLRAKLEALGYSPDYIAAAIARRKEVQQERRDFERENAVVHEPFEDLPDVGYKPAPVDRLLTGQGRAVGAAARAVKRGKTVTLHEYREAES